MTASDRQGHQASASRIAEVGSAGLHELLQGSHHAPIGGKECVGVVELIVVV